jgi:hypothetical protein
MRAFEDIIILQYFLGTPIVTMVSSIEAYTLNPWDKRTLATMLVLMHPTNPTFLAPNLFPPMATRYLVLPQEISITPPQHPRADQSHIWSNTRKKQRYVVTNDTVKHAQLDLGMFWLTNPKMKMNKIFPYDLGEKVCIQFCCRG